MLRQRDEHVLHDVVPAAGHDGAVVGVRDGTIEARGRDNVVQDVLVALAQHGIRPESLRLEQSSLEDAFVALTSHVEV